MGLSLRRTQCPTPGCDGQGDNLHVYEDGVYCFSCGHSDKKNMGNRKAENILEGQCADLPARHLKKQVCEKFQYQVGRYTGKLGNRFVTEEPVHIANYLDARGNIKAQKLRSKDKQMTILGDGKELGLYGQWAFEPSANVFVTIVEGEIDALSVAQAQGIQYPVVSVPNGAGGAAKAIQRALPWLSGFKHVVLAFDNDEEGLKATQECLTLFEPGRVRVAKWPLKDANDMLAAGRGAEISQVLFSATTIRPQFIVEYSDIKERVLKKPEIGMPFIWPTLTDITYGLKTKEITVWVGPRGIGKTEVIRTLISDLIDKNVKIGLFSFEEDPEYSVHRIVGPKIKQRLHLFEGEWDQEQINSEAQKLQDKLFLYDNSCALDKVTLLNSIRYLAKAKDVKLIVVDNLKGLCRGSKEENAEIKQYMLDFQSIAKELDIAIFLVSHVAKDKFQYSTYISTSPKNKEEYLSRTSEDMQNYLHRPGLSWESGRMPMAENIEGSSAVSDLANYVFALARNMTSHDEDKNIIRVKCLKARRNGAKTGTTFKLIYNEELCTLTEMTGVSDVL